MLWKKDKKSCVKACGQAVPRCSGLVERGQQAAPGSSRGDGGRRETEEVRSVGLD